MDLEDLMVQENLHIKRLAELVHESIQEEGLLSAKLLELEHASPLSRGQRLADKVAELGGSWGFISGFFLILAIWIGMNAALLGNRAFDPYPFILLNLVLSCLAAIQAPIIMMSQNRREDTDRLRSRNDYMINLKSEIEIRGLHGKIDLLIADQMKSLFSIQQAQLDLLLKIEKTLAER